MTLRCLFIFSSQVVLKIFVVSCAINYDDEKNACFTCLYSHQSVCRLLLKICSLFLCSGTVELLFFKKYWLRNYMNIFSSQYVVFAAHFLKPTCTNGITQKPFLILECYLGRYVFFFFFFKSVLHRLFPVTFSMDLKWSWKMGCFKCSAILPNGFMFFFPPLRSVPHGIFTGSVVNLWSIFLLCSCAWKKAVVSFL